MLGGVDPSDAEIDPLAKQALQPDVQTPARLSGASEHNPEPKDTAPFRASTMLFAVPTGLENSSKPRMKHAFVRTARPSTNSRDIATQDIGPQRLGGHHSGDSQNSSLLNADATGSSEGRATSSTSSQSARTLHGDNISEEAASNPVRVYTFQKSLDWRQERLSQVEILQRLAKLDLDPLGVLHKKLNLPAEHQAQIDAIQAKVNDEEINQKGYEWSLRQLELVLKKRRIAWHSPRMMAMIIYLEREARQLQSAYEIGGETSPADTHARPVPATQKKKSKRRMSGHTHSIQWNTKKSKESVPYAEVDDEGHEQDESPDQNDGRIVEYSGPTIVEDTIHSYLGDETQPHTQEFQFLPQEIQIDNSMLEEAEESDDDEAIVYGSCAISSPRPTGLSTKSSDDDLCAMDESVMLPPADVDEDGDDESSSSGFMGMEDIEVTKCMGGLIPGPRTSSIQDFSLSQPPMDIPLLPKPAESDDGPSETQPSAIPRPIMGRSMSFIPDEWSSRDSPDSRSDIFAEYFGNLSPEPSEHTVASDSVLDDDLIKQLTLLLTPAGNAPVLLKRSPPEIHQGESTISII